MSHDPEPAAPASRTARAPLWQVLSLQLLLVAGSGICGYLIWVSLSGSELAGCQGEAGCEAVLRSRWSRWWGLPVAMPAVSLYVSMLVVTWFLRIGKLPPAVVQLAGTILLALAITAGLAAVWFLSLQWLAVEALCPYCIAVHVCSLVLLAVLLIRPPIAGRGWAPAVLIGILAAAVLIVGQLQSSGPRRYELESMANAVGLDPFRFKRGDEIVPPEVPGEVAFLGGAVRLDPTRHARLGPRDAEHAVLFLFDYTCRHCRKLNQQLDAARKQTDGGLAVYCLPVPLHPDCNHQVPSAEGADPAACPLARLAMAVWTVQPVGFAEYHAWLFAEEQPPSLEAARDEAARRIGSGALSNALDDWALGDELGQQAELYGFVGAGMTPKLLLPRAILSGVPESDAELQRILNQQFQAK